MPTPLGQSSAPNTANSLIEQAKAGGWYAWLVVGAVLVVIILGIALYKVSKMLNDR